jgi:arylsulfatase A-like enzyme
MRSSARDREPSFDGGRFRAWLDTSSVLVLVLAGATALGGLVSRSGLRDSRLSAIARLGLFAVEILAGALVIALVLTLGALLEGLRERTGHLWIKRSIGAVRFSLTWLVLVAYFISIALFWSIGSFLDAEALTFVSVDSMMLFKHFIEMSPKLLVFLPLGALVAIGGGARAFELLFARGSARLFRGLRRTTATVLVGSLALVVWGETSFSPATAVVRDAEHGGFTTTGQLYRHAEVFRSGPMSHFLLTFGRTKGQPSPQAGASKATRAIAPSLIRMETPPLVSMADYVAGVALPPEKRLNVIVLLVESLRPDVLRSTGGRDDVMPALDALSEQSRRFVNAYAESSHSDYADLCPMSSHYPLRSGDHHYYPVHPAYPRVLVYDVLKALGYRTAIVSSQNERWGGMYNYLDTGGLDHFFHAETFHTTVVDPEDTVFSKWTKEFGQSGKVDDRYTIDEAIRWIGESSSPFFVYVNLQNSHFPYRTPDEFPKRFVPYAIDFPYTFGKYPIEKLEVVKNRYKNSLAYMDAQIGRLLAYLRRTGRFDRTVIVATGDNGEAFYEHGTAAHAGPIFDEAVRVAMMVHGPGVTPGTDSRLAQHIDIPPTIFGILGIEPHPSFQGIDLVRTEADPKRSAYLTVQTAITSQLALVREGFKLVADFNYGRYFLYDLAHDPGETRDLSGTLPDQVTHMAGRLHAWQKAQLEYYADPTHFRSTYPPRLSDADP